MTNAPEPLHLATTDSANGTGGQTISIWTYVNIALRRRYLILLISLGGAALVATSTLLSPRQYVASASFLPQERTTQQAGGLGQLAAQFGIAAPQAEMNSPQFYADLLKSREILRDVVEGQYDMGDSRGDLVAYFRLSYDRETSVARAVQKLSDITTVAPDRNGVVRVAVETTIPELSLQLINRSLQMLNDYNLERRQSQARAEREFVERRLGLAKDSLTASEDALLEFYKRNRSLGDSPELVAESQRLQRKVTFEQQLYLTLAQSHESAKLEEVRNTPVITVVERPEGFVLPQARHTIRKTIVAFLLSSFMALAVALLSESWRGVRRSASSDYQEFQTLYRDTIADLKGARLRRRRT